MECAVQNLTIMTKILIGILLLVGAVAAKADDGRKVTLSATNSLPTTYTASSPSLVLSEIGTYNKNIVLFATMNNVACMRTSAPGSDVNAPATPTKGNMKEIYLFASQPAILYNAGFESNIYCRSNTGGSMTAGEIAVLAYQLSNVYLKIRQ